MGSVGLAAQESGNLDIILGAVGAGQIIEIGILLAGAGRDADYDMAGGRDARRRIFGRREALFPSNAQ